MEAYVLVVIANVFVVVLYFERYCNVLHFFINGVLPYHVAVYIVKLQGLACALRDTYAVLGLMQSETFMYR